MNTDNLKRYVVKVDFYIYAENDNEASDQAKQLCNDIKDLDATNKASILEIGEQPWKTFEYRKFDLSVNVIKEF